MKKNDIKAVKWLSGFSCMLLLCFAGCGSGSTGTEDSAAMKSSYGDDIYYEESEEAAVEEAAEPQAAEGAQAGVAANRKLIKEVSMEVETEEFEVLVPKIEQKAENLGGYIESLNLYNGSGYYGSETKSASLTVRIPKDKIDGFVTEIAEISNVVRREESTEDITLQYVDTESRKKALEIEQDRLLVLLETADDLESIIALESRLSEIRYELQNMESRLRTYDNLVDYATVHLSINEVAVLTPVAERTPWEKMSAGFIRSLNNIKAGFVNLFIGLVSSIPYLVLIAIMALIIAAITLFILKLVNKRAVKKGKQYGLETTPSGKQKEEK